MVTGPLRRIVALLPWIERAFVLLLAKLTRSFELAVAPSVKVRPFLNTCVVFGLKLMVCGALPMVIRRVAPAGL